MERIQKLKEFLVANPSDSFVQHALALEYIKQGDDAMAKTLFETVLEREPGYIGSYYHLAKLLERNNDIVGATAIYEKGMAESRKAGDDHSLAELRAAYEEMTF